MTLSLTTGQCAAIMNEVVDMVAFSSSAIRYAIRTGALKASTVTCPGTMGRTDRRIAVSDFRTWLASIGFDVSEDRFQGLVANIPVYHQQPPDLSPDKRKRQFARARANYNERVGRLVRQPCEVCGSLKTEKHHVDYDRPLDIRWLCHTHHMAMHRRSAS